MKLSSLLATIAAFILTAGFVQAEGYDASYYAQNGTAEAPKNLRIAPGIAKSTAVVGDVIASNSISRQIQVRDAQNRVHTFTLPAGKNLRAFSVGKVQVSHAGGRTIDIRRAG